ncbi:MAG: HD domain-containing phosphohydrolase [Pseudomonadota bacterium]
MADPPPKKRSPGAPTPDISPRGCGQGVLVVSLDRRILWANDAARRALLDDDRALVGQPCHLILRGRDAPCATCPMDLIRNSGLVTTCCPPTGPGSASWEVALHPVPGPQGDTVELVASLAPSVADPSQAAQRMASEADLTLIYTVSEMDARGCSLDDATDLIVRQLRANLDAGLVGLYLPSRDARFLCLVARSLAPTLASRLGAVLAGSAATLALEERADSALWHALRGRRPTLLVAGPELDALLQEHARSPLLRHAIPERHHETGLAAAILAPLRSGGMPVGLLLVGAGRSFGPADLERLRRLAESLGDLLRRKLARDERRESQQRTAAILSAVADGVVGLDTAGRVTFANRSAIELLGWQRLVFIGRSLEQLHVFPAQEQASPHPLQEALQAGHALHQVETRLTAATGSLVEVACSVAPLEEEGEVRGAVVSFSDIGARKRSEEDLDRSLHHLRLALTGTVQALGRMAEMRDPYTAGHQQRVADLAVRIATRLGLPPDAVELVRLAAVVHDIGKIAIPVELLTKPGQLSAHELDLLRTHTTVGWEILKEARLHPAIAEIALQHHERLDGSGYPGGLEGRAILREARIIAVADTVEAMASHRPYRPARGLDDALAEILRERGRLYDPEAVDACLRVIRFDGFTFSEL